MLFLFIQVMDLEAQLSRGGNPHSMNEAALKSTAAVPIMQLKSLDINKLIEEDKTRPLPMRYSVFKEAGIDITKEGLHERSEKAGGEIWRCGISSPGSRSLQLYFSRFNVPPGATLFVYDSAYSVIYGAFTSDNVSANQTFMLADFPSDHLFLEYFEPYGREFSGQVVIGSIGQAYRDLFSGNIDENGLLNVNCLEGKDWQDEKHAVCRISFVSDGNGYLCTGSLLNNTRQDATPYLLTASHCISRDAEAQSLVAYFNYELRSCNEKTLVSYRTMSGASLLTLGFKSDYSLLQLSATPPASYQPYYAGWDITDLPGESSVGIHHADGGPKKISVDYSPAVTREDVIWWDTLEYSPAGSHWQVQFDNGMTSTGASGSPLFNSAHYVIGQLHGGDDHTDFYGKLSYSWKRSSDGKKTLQSYLDPDNSGIQVLAGYYPPQNLPDVQFMAEYDQVCLNAPVTLYNGSAFSTTSWKWTFTPDVVSYADSTSSTSENPVVIFNAPGRYDVKLSARNAAGTSIKTVYKMIGVGDSIDVAIIPVDQTDSCLCSFDSLTILAGGAHSYTWNLPEGSEGAFYIEDSIDNRMTIKHNGPELNDSVKNIVFTVMGVMGSCTDTLEVNIPLISQPNDNVENAIQISPGRNGPFTNKCASVEYYEPVPPHVSCTGQLSWCDETGVDILMNSVWFWFTAPASGMASLYSEGMDNEIAVYDADTYQDILSGKYSILAANDDRSSTNYNPVIYSMQVTPGKKYWIQVDGSGGGSEGSFYLNLDDKPYVTQVIGMRGKSLRIFPVPAGDYAIIDGLAAHAGTTLRVELFTMSGIRLAVTEIDFPEDGRMLIETGALQTGMYVARVSSDTETWFGKLIK